MKKIIYIIFVISFITNSCKKYEKYEFYDYDNPPEFGTFTDSRDGKTYKTVKIGNQVWMAENLAYKVDTGGCWAYCNDESYVATYGYLYNWETAKLVVPDGWHLPTYDEWLQLKLFIKNDGHSGEEGNALKSLCCWNGGAGNDNYGFSALPGGFYLYNYDLSFGNMGIHGMWWSSTEYSSGRADICYLYYGKATMYIHSEDKLFGLSVRCVKDSE